MKDIVRTCLLIVAILGYANTSSADAAAGKAKSAMCAACHGADGISSNEIWPNLAGQKRQYLINQITAFRDGKRIDPMMAPMVNSLSDADIVDLGEYFSSLKP